MAGTKELRVDAGELRSPSITPQGFLRVEGYVGRPGIYEYENTAEDEKKGYGKAGTIRRELRPDDVVFNQDGLDSFEGAPMTVLHPKKLVDVKNVRALEVGSAVGKAWRVDTADGPRVATAMVVKDEKTIARVNKRELVELSPGYNVIVERRSGVDPKYGKYDLIQREIEINHLALVPRARGGGDLRVRMDAADTVTASEVRCDSMWFGDVTRPGEVKLTSSADGHQHSINTSQSGAGETSYALSSGASTGHTHAWVKDYAGKVTIAEAEGHTHTVLDDRVNTDSSPAQPPAPKPALERGAHRTDAAEPRRGATTMDPEEQIRSLKAQLAEAIKNAEERQVRLDAATTRADQAEGKAKTFEDKITELNTLIAAGATTIETEAIREQATRADAAEEKIAHFEQRFDEAVNKRTSIMRRAMVIMGDEFNPDKMSNRAIQCVVVQRLDSKADISDGVSDATIEGRFDSLVDLHARSARSLTRIGNKIVGGATETRNDGGGADSRETRANNWRNQGREPLPSSVTRGRNQKGA